MRALQVILGGLLVLVLLSSCTARAGTSVLAQRAAGCTTAAQLEGWRFSKAIPLGGWVQRNAAALAFTRGRGDEPWRFIHCEYRGDTLRILPGTLDPVWSGWLDRVMLRHVAALSRERSSYGLRYHLFATDVAQPAGLFIESPGGGCAFLLPAELDALNEGNVLGLKGFLRRLDEAVMSAEGGAVGTSSGVAKGDGRITAENAPLAVHIGRAITCPVAAAQESAESGRDIDGLEDDVVARDWFTPAPLVLSHGVVRNHHTGSGGRSIDAALLEERDVWALTSSDASEREDAAWRLAKRFDPRGEPGFATWVEWPLLFGLEQSAARGEAWPLEVAAHLVAHDPGTDHGRILYQWLGVVAAWYHRDQPKRVEALLLSLLHQPETYRRSINAALLAHLNGPRTIGVLRDISKRSGDRWGKLSLALIHAGDAEALVPFYRQMSGGNLSHQYHGLCNALGMVPSQAFAEAGFPGLRLADRTALARVIPSLVESGQVVTLLPSLPVDDPAFARWLIERHRSGHFKPLDELPDVHEVNRYLRDAQMEMLGLLARQSGREAAAYLVGLCRAGDEKARWACAEQWNPRFFPAATVTKHNYWEMDDAVIAATDWEVVLAAAAEGRLISFTPGTAHF